MSTARTHILDVGRRLTAQRGYTSVGLSELLTTAEVPKGSFYHYFASKEDYGCALLKHYVHLYRGELVHSLGNEALTGRDRIVAYFADWQKRQTTESPDQKCLIVKLAAEIADLSPDMRAILRDGVDEIIKKLSDTLLVAACDGSAARVDNTTALATVLYQIWLGASLMAHLSQDAAPFAVAMSRTQALIRPS